MLITTPNFISSLASCADFGAEAPGSVVFREDSYLLPDPELFGTMFALDHHEKVQGLILSTDTREWPMDRATLTDPVRQIKRRGEKRKRDPLLSLRSSFLESEDKRYDPDCIKKSGNHSFLYGRNAFADQLGQALVTRSLRRNFPSTRLEEQYRLAESLMAFPSRRAYGCNSFFHERALVEASSMRKFRSIIRN